MRFSRRDFLKLIGVVPATLIKPEEKKEIVPVAYYDDKEKLVAVENIERLAEDVWNTPISTISKEEPIMSGSSWSWSAPYTGSASAVYTSFIPLSLGENYFKPMTRKDELKENFAKLGVKESKFDKWYEETNKC